MKKMIVVALMALGLLLLMGETESDNMLLAVKMAGAGLVWLGLELAHRWKLWCKFINED